MKSLILKEIIKQGLLMAERIASKSPSLPVLGNVLLSAKPNILELSATDLEVGMRYSVLSKNESEGQVVVSPKSLSQFLGTAGGAQVLLEKNEQGLVVEVGDFRAIFKTLNPEEFPIIPSAQGGEEAAEVQVKEFCQGLSLVVNFTGQTQARPEISGVFFQFQKKVLTLATTDSFRLAEKTMLLKKEVPAERSFILPSKTARELISLFGERTGVLSILFSSAQIMFEYAKEGESQEPKIQLVSRLIEGEYPHYQDVIPGDTATKAIVNSGEFLSHVKAASIFSGKTSDVRLVFNPQKQGIELYSRSSELGENTSFLKGKIEGKKIEISFNWKFLGDGLASLKNEEIEFSLTSEDGAAVIKPVREQGYLYVLMPIKA